MARGKKGVPLLQKTHYARKEGSINTHGGDTKKRKKVHQGGKRSEGKQGTDVLS